MKNSNSFMPNRVIQELFLSPTDGVKRIFFDYT